MKNREKKMELIAQFCEKLGYRTERHVIDNQVFWRIVCEDRIKLNLTIMDCTEDIHVFFSPIGGFCIPGMNVSEISAVKINKRTSPETIVHLNEHDGISIFEMNWDSEKSAVSDEEVDEFNRAMKEGEEE